MTRCATSTSSAEDPAPTELVESLDWRHFSAAINARLTYLQELGLPGETGMLPL